MTQRELNFGRERFNAEQFFAKRLADHGHAINAGDTDPHVRRERIRAAILEAHLDCAIIGKNAAGKTETYQQLFERHYGEPLTAKPTKEKSHAHP